MSTYAIGDIHGCLDALEDLLAVVEPELTGDDEVVFLGDYIDDGPDIRGAVARILQLRAAAPCTVVALMGNHEQWMLRSRSDPTSHSWLFGMGGLSTIRSYSADAAADIESAAEAAGPRLVLDDDLVLPYDRFFDAMPADHLEFFLTLAVFHRSPDVLCVHGGTDTSGGPVEDLPAEQVIWGPPAFPTLYSGAGRVVYGHHNDADLDARGWPRPRVTNGRAFGIDTVRHGVLTAMRFPDRRVFQSRRFAAPD